MLFGKKKTKEPEGVISTEEIEALENLKQYLIKHPEIEEAYEEECERAKRAFPPYIVL